MSRLKKGSRKKLTPQLSNRGVTIWKIGYKKLPKALCSLRLQNLAVAYKIAKKCLYLGWIFPEREKRAESPRKQAFACFFSYLDTSRNNSRGNFKPRRALNPLILLVFWAKKNPIYFWKLSCYNLRCETKIMKGEVRIFLHVKLICI